MTTRQDEPFNLTPIPYIRDELVRAVEHITSNIVLFVSFCLSNIKSLRFVFVAEFEVNPIVCFAIR